MAEEHVDARGAISTLIRFGRLVAEAATTLDVFGALADAARDHVGADAAVVLRVADDGAFDPVAARGVELGALARPEPEVVVSELAAWALGATKGAFARAHVCMMISGADLYGALVVLVGARAEPDFELADALVDLVAIAVAKRAQLEDLRRSHDALRAAQATLVRSEKLRALGQMAAGVSHDLKNVLNPLWLYLQVLERAAKKQGDAGADLGETVVEMRKVLSRGLETVERLRDYARQEPEARAEIVDLDKVVDEAAGIAKARMSSHVKRPALRIAQSLGAPKPIRGREADVVSAVVNLVVNAIDAMDAGGTITLTTGGDATSSFIVVADDGPGMTPEVERRVFEPFFTTKGDDGTGLGLAMVFACMERHAGTVRLETSPGHGARFTLTFPVG